MYPLAEKLKVEMSDSRINKLAVAQYLRNCHMKPIQAKWFFFPWCKLVLKLGWCDLWVLMA